MSGTSDQLVYDDLLVAHCLRDLGGPRFVEMSGLLMESPSSASPSISLIQPQGSLILFIC